MSVGQAATADSSLLGQSPVGWRVDRIRDHLSGIVGGEWGDDPDAHDDGIELPVIRVADIRDLDLTVDGLTIRRIKESKLTGRLIGKQTILLEKSGGGENKPVGRAVRTNRVTFDAICSNFMAKVDCCDTVAPEFVVYMLDALYSSGVNGACIQQTTGIQNLRVLDYLNTKVAFPPLHEQQNIAAYLDASCAAIDAAVSAKRRQLDTLDALKSSILLKALTLGLNPNIETRATGATVLPIVPVGWGFRRLKSVAAVRYGLGQPPVELSSGVGMIRATDVDAGTIRRGNFLRVDPDDLPLGRNPYLKAGEIIVVRSGAYTGDSAIVPSDLDGMVAGYDMVVTATRTSPRFLAYCLLSRYVLEGQIFLLTLRAAQPHLNAEELGGIQLALPPTLDEQEAIADFVDVKFGELNRLRATITAQIDTLTAYRKSLIHECVTGQRRVTEADVAAIA